MLANPTSRTSFIRLSFPISVVALLLAAISLTTRAAEAPQNEDNQSTTANIGVGAKVDTTPKEIIDTTERNKIHQNRTKLMLDSLGMSGKKTKIILNGKPTKLTIDEIDPNTIESITVFKDKAATDMYGSSGKKGVINIEQKRANQDQLTKWYSRVPVSTNILDFRNGMKPLIIVNGKEYIEPMANFDRNTIKKMYYIHDISAVKVYGDKGKNGVIEIELKDGSQSSHLIMGKDPYMHTLVQPKFVGGKEALNKFLAKNIMFPEVAEKEGEEGTVIVRFVVGIDGSISSVLVMKGVCRSLNEEAIRVVKSMPKWIPGTLDGAVVATFHVVPINFSLRGYPTR